MRVMVVVSTLVMVAPSLVKLHFLVSSLPQTSNGLAVFRYRHYGPVIVDSIRNRILFSSFLKLYVFVFGIRQVGRSKDE